MILGKVCFYIIKCNKNKNKPKTKLNTACGPATGNRYCLTANNDYEYACIPANSTFYKPDLDQDPFSVEVGDWSGKYGSIVLDSDNKYGPMTFSSFYEVEPDELEGLSVVFHCNNGARAFCAPFEESQDNTESTTPSQNDEKTVVAYFKGLSEESMIKLEPDGTVTGTIDATLIFNEITSGCSMYEYTIFNPSSEIFNFDECFGSTDGQYDPTNQCLPWSDSKYCVDGSLCNDPNYSYDCDFSSDRYSCAPGDLSGKFGKINPKILLTISESGPTTLIPPTEELIGKIIGITCPYTDTDTDIEFLACAEIVEYVTTTTEAPGKANQILLVIPLIISSLVAFVLN